MRWIRIFTRCEMERRSVRNQKWIRQSCHLAVLEEKTEPTQVEKKNEWNERWKLYFVSSFHSVDEIEDGGHVALIQLLIGENYQSNFMLFFTWTLFFPFSLTILIFYRCLYLQNNLYSIESKMQSKKWKKNNHSYSLSTLSHSKIINLITKSIKLELEVLESCLDLGNPSKHRTLNFPHIRIQIFKVFHAKLRLVLSAPICLSVTACTRFDTVRAEHLIVFATVSAIPPTVRKNMSNILFFLATSYSRFWLLWVVGTHGSEER